MILRWLRLTLAGLVCLAGCGDVGNVVQRYGFTEVRPPSALFAPGTVVWVKRGVPFEAGIVCSQLASLGPHFHPTPAAAATAVVAEVQRGGFTLAGPALASVTAAAGVQGVRRVAADLSNAVVLTASDAAVMEGLMERSPACARAIRARTDAGYQLTMVASALQADVTYTVSMSADSNADAKDTLAALAPRLGATTFNAEGERTMTGQGLVWGIHDDPYLAALSGLTPPWAMGPLAAFRGGVTYLSADPPDAP